MASQELSRRERKILEAVILSYVETAEPAGSRTLSRRFGLGVSPATIRNTMSDLEEKGFLFHPHTSAGRVPTNKAYRVYVDQLLTMPPRLTAVLNERLAGLTLDQIRRSLAVRLRDASAGTHANELLNIFVQEAEHLFDAALPDAESVLLGQPSVLAEQPEFSAADRLRRLLALTERPDALAEAIRRRTAPGVSITIGTEHDDPRLEEFTVVTAEYNVGSLTGVIGVIGPTRMPYDKVISLVSHTSRLLNDLLQQ